MNYQSHHKTEWLTLLRSWAVLLVVICHSPLIDLENEVGDLARHFNAIFSLRMPLFFFISGFLLYLTKISKKSTFKTIFNSSISRILFPYLFITIVLFLLKGLFSHLFKQETNFSFLGLLKVFVYPAYNPLVTMWFLNAILIFFLTYPIIKFSLTKNIYTFSLGALCVILYIFTPQDILFLDFSTSSRYYVFFYSGILFAKFKLDQHFELKYFLITLTVFISSIYFHFDGITTLLTGIAVFIYVSQKIIVIFPKLFSSFSKYYFQIYLFGTLFQIVILELFAKFHLNDNNYLFSIISILSGLYLPVILSKCVEIIDYNPINKIFGFK